MTDFGLRDQYVFQMKAVIKRISPTSEIIDISHEIPKFDIPSGSFVLAQAARYLPESSAVVAVVDPGVGSDRRCIAIRTRHHYFVGPDNGLLYEAVRMDPVYEVREITSKEITLRRGGTFDGRDVFAPTAAHLVEGYPFSKVGPKLNNVHEYKFTKPDIREDKIIAHILYVDSFGNAVLDVTGGDFFFWAQKSRGFVVEIGEQRFHAALSSSYASITAAGLIQGSSGYMELSTNRGGAVSADIKTGIPIIITRSR
jgi:S-adenosylmethionine hydrolase